MMTFLEIPELKKWGAVTVMALGISLSGCGGSSDGSDGSDNSGDSNFATADFNESQAVVSGEDDAKTVSTAVVESAQQAIFEEEQPDLSSVPTAVSIAASDEEFPVYDISKSLIEAAIMPSAVDVPVDGDCGGQAVVSYNDASSSYNIDYQDYCTGTGDEQYTINGHYYWDHFDDSSYTLTFEYTVTHLGETYSSNGTYSCDNKGVCTHQNYFVGTDGRQYRTENVSVSDFNGAYSVRARVYDQSLGYVDYESSNLTLCDSGVGFSSGTITITASGDTLVEVTFSGCNSYTITYNGTAYTVNY